MSLKKNIIIFAIRSRKEMNKMTEILFLFMKQERNKKYNKDESEI